ncbi:ketopantoate reductase family protein [Campylobacterota bacterium]
MRIAIVGLGGVGAYIGAKLCALKDEHDIIFIARGEHLQAIQKEGLRIIDVDKEQTYYPTSAQEDISDHLDIVFLCTKTYHSKEALFQLSDAISKETLVIPVANGVNSREELQALTPAHVTDACVYIVSHKLSAGVIKKSTDVFALILSEDIQELLEPLLSKVGLRCKFSDDIKKELWKKFLFISAMGSMTSYYQVGMGSIYKEHKDELIALLNEIFSVAKAEAINIETKEIDKALRTASKLPLDAPTSLWLDIQNKGLNELETLCGYIVNKAKEHKFPTPIMRKIYDKLNT